MATYLMGKHNVFEDTNMKPQKFYKFMKRIQAGYKSVAYHNKTHGMDVCQSYYYFMMDGGLMDLCKFNSSDLAAAFIATSCHDFEHSGCNNQFLIETKNSLALQYNDISVLENHHIAASF